MPDGSAIYQAYLGPYSSFQEACDVAAWVRNGGYSDAYVRVLDVTTPPTDTLIC